MTDAIILSDNALKLAFSRTTGALIHVSVPTTGWAILDRPHLGLSFRLLVPSGRRRNNPVEGATQTLTKTTIAADGKSVHFVWDGVESLHAGHLDIRVEMEIHLQNGKAVFTTTLVNRTQLVIESVDSPCLGDLRHPPGAEKFSWLHHHYSGGSEYSIWPKFQNTRGYFGLDKPAIWHCFNGTMGAPMAPFILLRDNKQGLWVGIDKPEWELIAWNAELHPGHLSMMHNDVPAGDHIGEHDVFVRFAATHMCYIQPGQTRRLTPVAIQPYQGTWHVGADLYRGSKIQPTSAPAPTWAAKPHSWIQIHVNGPEGEARVKYRDLVPLAEEMARHGVTGMQITGWNFGGQDQDNPCHDTDPLLGTWEELRDAIRQIKAIGVKVILFVKFTWADRGTDTFKTEYEHLAVTDPHGDYNLMHGYQYFTPSQLLNISTKRLIPMCFLSEEYLKVCEREFAKTVALGADGVLFDENEHHGPGGLLCFNPNHGHRPGALVYANDNHLIERFRKISDPVCPEFLYAGEGNYDWEYETYNLSYFRSEYAGHMPLIRYLRPEALMATAVTGFDDRAMINQCLLYKYIISYEPFNFKGRIGDFPLTLEYGKKMDAVRTELRRWFWDGEFRDTLGATVTNPEGKAHHPFAVYLPKDGGAPGLAIANYDNDKVATLTVTIAGQNLSAYKYRLIDVPTWKPVGAQLVLPARAAAVLIPA